MSDANVFISHHHLDAPIAEALSDAIAELFQRTVSVSASTKYDGGGIPAGANWFNWIGREVARSQATVVLLTRGFLAHPAWLLWEVAAVYGVALSDGTHEARVRPLRYRIDADALPSPLRHANLQAARGDSPKEMEQFFRQLIREFNVLDVSLLLEAGAKLNAVTAEYIRRVDDCLKAPEPGPPGMPAPSPNALNRLFDLAFTAMQAFAPSVRMNGRYFYAAVDAGREVLVRDEGVYCETIPMPEEFGLSRLDVARDADTIVVCQSYRERTPIYRVLDAGLMARYPDEIRRHISPDQGWVLGCPVLVPGSKPWGVVCLYGTKPPARNDAETRRLLNVAVRLSEAFGRALGGTQP